MLTHPFNQLAPVRAINPHPAQLLAGAQPPQPPQHLLCTCWVRNRGGAHYDCHQQAQRINQQVSLATFDVLATVIPTHSWPLAGLDALAVQTAPTRVLVASEAATQFGSEHIVNTLPGTIIAPSAEVVVDAFPLRV